VQEALRKVMRTIARDAELTSDQEEQKAIATFARASQNRTRIDGAMQAIQDKLRVREDELDTSPWLLNVENGTVDLRTGTRKRHDRGDRITKLAPVKFDPNAPAPRFMKFLKQILVEDELIAFVQRFLGYSLAGSTEERAMAVLHGEGKNGKTTLVKLFEDMLGDYSFVAPPRIILRMQQSSSEAQYQFAQMKGARFVSMAETPRHVELEEATVKQITGNDTLNARHPFGRPFTYTPEFKLWMSTNHKPEIPDGSEAIWDRIRLIPFNQRFKGKAADTKLPAKLREEFSGVLAWAVRGCVEWGRHGLGSSKAVDDATAEYRNEADVTQRFLDDMCVFGPEHTITRKALFEGWEKWALEEGVEPGTQTSFTRLISERAKTLKTRRQKSQKWTPILARNRATK
jgi:putative DNA primase/helicase